MRSVNVARLKNQLSHYLREVQKGQEIVIRDRNRPVAKIVPISPRLDFSPDILRLAAEGKVILPKERLDIKAFLAMPKPRVARGKIAAAIRADRDDD
jgi:prevent-host-death family protein